MNTLSLNGINKHYGANHALIDFDYNLVVKTISTDSDSKVLRIFIEE